jgi:hypothetical protein
LILLDIPLHRARGSYPFPREFLRGLHDNLHQASNESIDKYEMPASLKTPDIRQYTRNIRIHSRPTSSLHGTHYSSLVHLRIADITFHALLHINESLEHPPPPPTQLITEAILSHPKQSMLEYIAGPRRSTARIAHAPMERRPALFRVICTAVQYIGVIEHRLTS